LSKIDEWHRHVYKRITSHKDIICRALSTAHMFSLKIFPLKYNTMKAMFDCCLSFLFDQFHAYLWLTMTIIRISCTTLWRVSAVSSRSNENKLDNVCVDSIDTSTSLRTIFNDIRINSHLFIVCQRMYRKKKNSRRINDDHSHSSCRRTTQ
jgi:hypothetical protein